eukprot:5516879-Amphidinium_carterae.1
MLVPKGKTLAQRQLCGAQPATMTMPSTNGSMKSMIKRELWTTTAINIDAQKAHSLYHGNGQ